MDLDTNKERPMPTVVGEVGLWMMMVGSSTWARRFCQAVLTASGLLRTFFVCSLRHLEFTDVIPLSYEYVFMFILLRFST